MEMPLLYFVAIPILRQHERHPTQVFVVAELNEDIRRRVATILDARSMRIAEPYISPTQSCRSILLVQRNPDRTYAGEFLPVSGEPHLARCVPLGGAQRNPHHVIEPSLANFEHFKPLLVH